MTITTIPWIVVLGFGAFFVFAAAREILHRRKHGPPDNPRDVFEFDEDAPSYEDPEPEPDAAQDDVTTDDTPHGTAEDSDDTPDPDADPDTADRNETPR